MGFKLIQRKCNRSVGEDQIPAVKNFNYQYKSTQEKNNFQDKRTKTTRATRTEN